MIRDQYRQHVAASLRLAGIDEPDDAAQTGSRSGDEIAGGALGQGEVPRHAPDVQPDVT